MNRAIHISTAILLGCLIFAGIAVHIKYLCWERQGFAVGGEWIAYLIFAAIFIWWVIYNDD